MHSSPCRACTGPNNSCCMDVQIYLTMGDVERVYRHLGRDGFVALEPPDIGYDEDPDDPTWTSLTRRPDGLRRVVRRRQDKSCCFLSPTGCALPLDMRPLLCRIYPYEFNRAGILRVDRDCPVSSCAQPPAALERMGMHTEAIEGWMRMLYEEIEKERGIQ